MQTTTATTKLVKTVQTCTFHSTLNVSHHVSKSIFWNFFSRHYVRESCGSSQHLDCCGVDSRGSILNILTLYFSGSSDRRISLGQDVNDEAASSLEEAMKLRFNLSTYVTNSGYRVNSAILKLYRIDDCHTRDTVRATIYLTKINGEYGFQRRSFMNMLHTVFVALHRNRHRARDWVDSDRLTRNTLWTTSLFWPHSGCQKVAATPGGQPRRCGESRRQAGEHDRPTSCFQEPRMCQWWERVRTSHVS